MIARRGRLLLALSALALALVGLPAADAGAARPQTIKLRVPVPSAGDLSVLSFELSIGGEGIHHRRQAVLLRLISDQHSGVFAIARLRPEPRRPGRFLGVLEVFHRRGAGAAARPSGLARLAPAAPFDGAHAAAPPSDELWVRARNERLIKSALKANIVALATRHKLGPYEFCSARSERTYILGNAIIGAAYLLAGPLTELPTGTTPGQLADDAVYELCDEVEDYGEGDYEEDDEEELAGIHVLTAYLGVPEPQRMPVYRVLFSGAFSFEGANEVKLTGLLSGASYPYPLAHSADSTNPVDAIKVVLPPAGTTPRKVTNYICPSQLPSAAITTTSNAGDTLSCSGGSLPLGQQFSLNIQSSPLPATGMGGQLLVHQDGAFLAPFSITGP